MCNFVFEAMKETKNKILDVGEKLVRTKGFNAFSYKDIAAPLHIKNAAIHYHFPSKTDLGVEIIQHTIQAIAAQKQQWQNLPEDEQLKNFADTYYRSHEAGLVCLMGSLAPDFETLPENMQKKLQEMGHEMLAWLTMCLENGRAKGIFNFTGEPYDKALAVVSSLLSSLLLARVLGKDIFRRINHQIFLDLQ